MVWWSAKDLLNKFQLKVYFDYLLLIFVFKIHIFHLVHDGTGLINCLIDPEFFEKNCYKENENEKNLPPEVQFLLFLSKNVYKQIPKETDLVPGQPVRFKSFFELLKIFFCVSAFNNWKIIYV